MMRKRKQNLPRFYLPPLVYDNPEIVEDYHRRLVVLFVPWADEQYIHDAFGCESHVEVWMAYLRELKIRNPEAHADLTKLLEWYTRIQNAEAELAKRMESIKKARKELQIDEEDEDLLKIQQRQVNKTRHKRNKRKLNEVQLEIFNENINGRGPSAYGRKYGRNWTQRFLNCSRISKFSKSLDKTCPVQSSECFVTTSPISVHWISLQLTLSI
ncbi:unnamed protein product [Caenorhabditis brenneri]